MAALPECKVHNHNGNDATADVEQSKPLSSDSAYSVLALPVGSWHRVNKDVGINY